jgi:hypothetical protein
MTRDDIAVVLIDELGRIAPQTDAGRIDPNADLFRIDIPEADYRQLRHPRPCTIGRSGRGRPEKSAARGLPASF